MNKIKFTLPDIDTIKDVTIEYKECGFIITECIINTDMYPISKESYRELTCDELNKFVKKHYPTYYVFIRIWIERL